MVGQRFGTLLINYGRFSSICLAQAFVDNGHLVVHTSHAVERQGTIADLSGNSVVTLCTYPFLFLFPSTLRPLTSPARVTS